MKYDPQQQFSILLHTSANSHFIQLYLAINEESHFPAGCRNRQVRQHYITGGKVGLHQ